MTAEHFVALTFGDVRSVLEAFLPELERMASKAGCGDTRIILPGDQPVLLTRVVTWGREAARPMPIRALMEISQNMA